VLLFMYEKTIMGEISDFGIFPTNFGLILLF
jgi:hypothetical protein